MKEPMNAVERAMAAMARGPEARPECFRQLREATLCFLMPYHPEMEGLIGVGNGDTTTFSVWQNKEKEFIPIFTSLDRATQALKATGAKDNQYCIAEMKGSELFQIITCHKKQVVINPACGMNVVYLDQNAVEMLGDGSILEPIKPVGPRETRRMIIVKPEEYPTDFLQPLFQFLRGRPEALAGWLFRFKTPKPPLTVEYGFLLVASGNWEQLKQDFGVVAHSLCMKTPEMYFNAQVTHPGDPAIATMLAPLHPFFLAPHYQLPRPAPGDKDAQNPPPA